MGDFTLRKYTELCKAIKENYKPDQPEKAVIAIKNAVKRDR